MLVSASSNIVEMTSVDYSLNPSSTLWLSLESCTRAAEYNNFFSTGSYYHEQVRGSSLYRSAIPSTITTPNFRLGAFLSRTIHARKTRSCV